MPNPNSGRRTQHSGLKKAPSPIGDEAELPRGTTPFGDYLCQVSPAYQGTIAPQSPITVGSTGLLTGSRVQPPAREGFSTGAGRALHLCALAGTGHIPPTRLRHSLIGILPQIFISA